MTLLHPALLFGLALMVVPVALHLLLRARPKKLVFPALRLLRQRRLQNQRRMRLRHLWLLLLRMLLIAAIVFVVARPSLPAANYRLQMSEVMWLLGIFLAAAGIYAGCLFRWKRQKMPVHVLQTRRTYLRGGIGLGTFLLMLLIVGWPYQRRIAAELTSPRPHVLADLPVAAVFLCDTSLSMTYQQGGKSRLEAAREIAVRHLGHLPIGSQAAVMDMRGEIPAVMTPDLTAVQNRLEALQPQTRIHSLNEQVKAAIRLQQDERNRQHRDSDRAGTNSQSDRYVREIYIFTDLTKSAWDTDESSSLAAQLKELEWLGLYLIDVGIEQPTEFGVIDLRLSRESVGERGSSSVGATIRRFGTTSEEAVVELWQATDDSKLAKRDQRTVNFAQDDAPTVQFSLDDIRGRMLQGELRLVVSDPLAMNNVASFTVDVLPAMKVLVCAPERSTAAFWLEALRVLSFSGSAYEPEFLPLNQFGDVDLTEFDVVCLLNAPQPTNDQWQKLQKFVETGGGVFITLGAMSQGVSNHPQNIDPVAYASEPARSLLPVLPKASLVFKTPAQLSFVANSIPMRSRLENLGALTELGDVDFRRYWSVDLQPGTAVLANWSGEESLPALAMISRGKGRCLVFTSSVDSTAWSDWPRNWTYLAVADQCLQLLSRKANSQHNFKTGDPVVIPLEADLDQRQLLLRQPDLTQQRLVYDPGSRDVVISDAEVAGNYQIVSGGMPPELQSGFSMNHLSAESDLIRLEPDELAKLLGKDRYGLARDPDQLTKSVLAGRFGQEISSWMLALLIGIFVIEQTTATWFYRQDETPSAAVA